MLFVLVVIGVLALVTLPLMILSTRRQQQAVPAETGAGKPLLSSSAQVWVSRGERVLRELTASLSGEPGFATLASDAEQVVAELRITAGQVAELDHTIARIPVPSLEVEQAALAQQVAEADGSPAQAEP